VRSEEFDFTVEALQELPRAPERGGPQWAVHRRGTPSEGAYGTATAAQRRYCQYFDMLHNKVIQSMTDRVSFLARGLKAENR
jgi:hypothetical protein